MEHEMKFISNPELKSVRSDYKGNILIDGRFSNSLIKDKVPTWNAIKWKLLVNPQKEEKRKDDFSLKVIIDSSFKDNKDNVIIWLGHSFFYIRLNGTVYLTDPIISNLPIIKRNAANPYTMRELGKIDYILISHTHFDHFDIPTLEKIIESNPNVEILGPLGMNTLLKNKKFTSIKRQEAGWFQTFKTENNTVTFLPAKHWSRRGLFDFNKILWGSFAISSSSFKIYFAGDTAKELDFFSSINSIYNGFDVCLIPIGSYSPRFLMEEEHVNPQEALELFRTLNGKCLIPMHYGVYDMSDEPIGEPIRLLKENAKEKDILHKIFDVSIGDPLYLV
jgi:L-ascorbate metabolism protein UlaG (beta-lactamase superfamily)